MGYARFSVRIKPNQTNRLVKAPSERFRRLVGVPLLRVGAGIFNAANTPASAQNVLGGARAVGSSARAAASFWASWRKAGGAPLRSSRAVPVPLGCACAARLLCHSNKACRAGALARIPLVQVAELRARLSRQPRPVRSARPASPFGLGSARLRRSIAPGCVRSSRSLRLTTAPRCAYSAGAAVATIRRRLWRTCWHTHWGARPLRWSRSFVAPVGPGRCEYCAPSDELVVQANALGALSALGGTSSALLCLWRS
jgi:hypothetical protein